jgi:3-oxoacyl-[acyl-carrier-protein] synthase II
MGKEPFFQALIRGESGIAPISAFPTDELDCKIAGEVRDFEPFRWISRKDLPHVPRTVPMALAAASEALADARLEPETLPLEERRRFGVILGSGGGGVGFLERQYQLFFSGRHRQNSVYAIPSNTMGTLSSELSMRFSLKGPSHVLSTGCTSSTDAIGYAYQHIQAGRLARALCGGVDAPLTPATLAGFALMKVLSRRFDKTPSEASRPFSRDRDGFVPAEGAWLFLLEEKSVALARGAPIYAEVIGYGATCDAYHRVRLHEEAEEPARAIQEALQDAGFATETDRSGAPMPPVDYINLHGTSTLLNDRIETKALKRAFGRKAYDIPASSTKSMIGHPQGASGAAGVASILCAMETGFLPPTINLTQFDPDCDLDYVPDIGRRREVRLAIANCMGFGSKNSVLILKKAES